MTWLILIAVLVIGVGAYRAHQRERSHTTRRKTFAWAWAFWGGALGSFFGVAGFGGAMVGTGLGALLGYLAATALMKVDKDGREKPGLLERLAAEFDRAEHEKQQDALRASEQADRERQQAEYEANAALNENLRGQISQIDEQRKSLMRVLFDAGSGSWSRRSAASKIHRLDKKRANLVRNLR